MFTYESSIMWCHSDVCDSEVDYSGFFFFTYNLKPGTVDSVLLFRF